MTKRRKWTSRLLESRVMEFFCGLSIHWCGYKRQFSWLSYSDIFRQPWTQTVWLWKLKKKGDRCYLGTESDVPWCLLVLLCAGTIYSSTWDATAKITWSKWNRQKLTMATWWSSSGHRLHQFSFHDHIAWNWDWFWALLQGSKGHFKFGRGSADAISVSA